MSLGPAPDVLHLPWQVADSETDGYWYVDAQGDGSRRFQICICEKHAIAWEIANSHNRNLALAHGVRKTVEERSR